MRLRSSASPHPDLFPSRNETEEAQIERLVEQRLAARFESESFRWRFRLVCIETTMIGLLVLVSGFLLHQPRMMVLRATAIVAASCFATGILLLVLSVLAARLLSRWRRRRVS